MDQDWAMDHGHWPLVALALICIVRSSKNRSIGLSGTIEMLGSYSKVVDDFQSGDARKGSN